MPGSLSSLVDNLLSQIRESKGGASGGNDPMASFRPITEQERSQRGIDPRDPNRFSVNDQGQMMQTLIGFNPGNAKSPLPTGSAMSEMMRKFAGKNNQVDEARKAAGQAAGGGRPNFSRPIGKLPNGVNLEARAGEQANKAIPKSKSNLQRLSPGVYRDAKGNLVRK